MPRSNGSFRLTIISSYHNPVCLASNYHNEIYLANSIFCTAASRIADQIPYRYRQAVRCGVPAKVVVPGFGYIGGLKRGSGADIIE
jgi:hypothetical protein